MLKDTTPEARRIQLKALASRSATDRLREAIEMSDAVHELAAAGARDRMATRERSRSAKPDA